MQVHVISSGGGGEDRLTVTVKEAAQRRDSLQLVCQVTGAAPPADVYWTVPGLGSGHELHKGAPVNNVLILSLTLHMDTVGEKGVIVDLS